MKLDKVKKTKTKVSSRASLFKKIVSVVLSIAVFSGSYYIINKAGADAKDTVEVLRVSAKDGLPAQSVFTEENLEKYQIIRKEYTQDMMLADNLDYVLEKYTTQYMRNGAILHIDEYNNEKLKKNEWIYDESLYGKEILTIPFNYLESGGDILTPGDRVRIRIKYEIEETEFEEDIDIWGEPYSRPVKQVKVEKIDTLFDDIIVTDMLNSKSHSIYEVYREVLRYPESERQRLLKSNDFMNNIIPKALVVAATDKEANKYMQYKSSSKGILITILPRDRDSIILDQLPTLEAEVGVWLENQKR